MPVMTFRRLKEILDRFPSLGIAVVGDFFLDKWLEIDRSLDEVSLETGLTAYQVTAKRLYAGAAGTVLSNLSALELGRLYALGFVGNLVSSITIQVIGSTGTATRDHVLARYEAYYGTGGPG